MKYKGFTIVRIEDHYGIYSGSDLVKEAVSISAAKYWIDEYIAWTNQ